MTFSGDPGIFSGEIITLILTNGFPISYSFPVSHRNVWSVYMERNFTFLFKKIPE
jgi:hypothetical protein